MGEQKYTYGWEDSVHESVWRFESIEPEPTDDFSDSVYQSIAGILKEYDELIKKEMSDPELPYYEMAQRYEMRRRATKSALAVDGTAIKARAWRVDHLRN